jgi:hypothetical protein
MTTKLPCYFEELINNKFSETNKKIDDLKIHVNDEMMSFKKQLCSFQRYMIVMAVAIIALLIIHVDQFGPSFMGTLKAFIGL